MRDTQIKGGKQSGKEADKEMIGQQNIHGKRRVLPLNNTVLGKTGTEEGFGERVQSNIDTEDKKMEKTSIEALDIGHCYSKSVDKLYTWTAETLLLLILIASNYNNLSAKQLYLHHVNTSLN